MQTSGAMTLADVLYPRTGVRQRDLIREVVLIAGFTLFTALVAQIAIRLPFTPIPITGSTLGVLVTGGVLGAWRGAGSLSLYMLLGVVGVPVFAPSVDMHFILPWKGIAYVPWDLTSAFATRGGYVVGFILAAWLVGYVAERGWDRKPWLLLGLLVGNILLYIPALLWLFYLISSEWVHPVAQQPLAELLLGQGSWDKALIAGLYPFILGDLVKLYVAFLLLPSAWALVGRSKR